MSAYNKAKRGPVPVDMKGFEKLVLNVKTALSRSSEVSVIYMKGKGFKVVTLIREKMQSLIDAEAAIVVGLYKKGVLAQHLVEDFVFMTDQIAMGEFK